MIEIAALIFILLVKAAIVGGLIWAVIIIVATLDEINKTLNEINEKVK